MQAPITLHYWPTPNGWKISIALEEMGLPYRVRLVNIGAGEQFDPDFLKIAPNNRMPAITDPLGPDGAPVSLFESGAILQYLARKTGLFCGPTERDRITVDQWLMWQMGGLGPMAGQAHHFLTRPSLNADGSPDYPQTRYREETARLYGVLDRQLEGKAFVAGDFLSIADFAIYPWASLWQKQQQELSGRPNLTRWLEALAARPAFARGRGLHLDIREAATKEEKAALAAKARAE